MQTDPIGYADGTNWYNYVGSDPVNATDPSGLTIVVIGRRSCSMMGDCRTVTDPLEIERLLQSLQPDIDAGLTRPEDEYEIVVEGSPPKKAKSPQSGKPKFCFGPPQGPAGTSASEMAAQAKINGDAAAQHSSTDLGWFKSQVQNNGPWDYKQFDRGYQAFGNYNYGYTGARQGIPTPVLRGAAGYAQVRAGTSSWKFAPSAFDDPQDQEQINRGIHDAQNGCY